ncbi:MAG: hypothetical protein GX046_09095 [Tissierellia bacterium]|nr:hypothetical protein [Tissierellia bacterium]
MFKKYSQPEKWILIGIPMLFLIGSLFHFLYEMTGKLKVIAAISATNESVWEHCKMVVLPVILWWGLYYIFRGNEYNINANKWFTTSLVAMVTAIITMPMSYYFYTQAFGVEILAVDIFLLFFVLILGQCLGLHVFKYHKGMNIWIALFLISIVLVIFIVFTFYQPHLPIFMDGVNHTYGI